MKKNYLALFKNLTYLFIGNFGSKILVFLMIPLYTSVLTTEEYGVYDLIYTSIMILIPILTFNVSEATLRFSLDSEVDHGMIFKISFKYIFRSILFIAFVVLLNNFFAVSLLLKKYSVEFFLLYFSNVLFTFFSNFLRGLDLFSELSVSAVVNTFSILIFNILFLRYFHFGVQGYFYSNILGFLFPSIYSYWVCSRKVKVNFSKFYNYNLEKVMLAYSKPLVYNAIGWWINSVSDRYIVTIISGVTANGIYSVAYKIPSMLSMLSTIFNQAWVISSSKIINSSDDEVFFSSVYANYNFLLVLSCSILITLSKILAKFLYLNDFYEAWKFVPFLLISTVFGGLSGFIGGIFAAQKNSKVFSESTIIGAIVNIVLNIILVFIMGPMGAAISTMVSYFIIWFVRVSKLKNDFKLRIPVLRYYSIYTILLFQAVNLIYFSENENYFINQMFFLLLVIVMFGKEFKDLLMKFKVR